MRSSIACLLAVACEAVAPPAVSEEELERWSETEDGAERHVAVHEPAARAAAARRVCEIEREYHTEAFASWMRSRLEENLIARWRRTDVSDPAIARQLAYAVITNRENFLVDGAIAALSAPTAHIASLILGSSPQIDVLRGD